MDELDYLDHLGERDQLGHPDVRCDMSTPSGGRAARCLQLSPFALTDQRGSGSGCGFERWAGILVLFLCVAAAGCGSQAPEYDVVGFDGEVLELELAGESDLPVHFFTFKADGKNVNFFVRKDRDGVIRTHFDACYSCFKYKLGYVEEGGQVVCRACRIGYALGEPIWDFVGPCVPITLSSRTEDGKIRIRRRDLEKGARFF